jgi:hypothetical protein
MARPCGLYIDTYGGANVLHSQAFVRVVVPEYQGTLGDLTSQDADPASAFTIWTESLRTSLLDNAQGDDPNQMIAPHGIAVDSAGDIYVGEVSVTAGLWFPRKD